MSEQNYIKAGFDLSSVSSASQEQVMQAIAGSTPISNIGFCIVSTTRPDITNNPEMIRFIWLDISTPSNVVLKRYIADRTVLVDADASWETFGVSNLSVLTAMIATRSTTGGVDLTRMKLNSDYSASLGSIYYLIRVAANGKDIEAVSLNTALADGGGVNLARLDLSGSGAQKYLGIDAGALGYKYLDPANDMTSALGNRIPVSTAIAPGTALYILRTNAAGTAAEWVSPSDVSLAIAIASLAPGGAAANDIIRFNGSVWEKVTPSLELTNGATISTTGVLGAINLGSATLTENFAHGLSSAPRLVRAVVRCTANDAATGYVIGDEIDVSCWGEITGADEALFAVYANATNVVVSRVSNSAANAQVIPAVGGNPVAPTALANFTPKVYAWR
jgi:hypothetical protein